MGLETCEGSIVGNIHYAFSGWYGICLRSVNLEWWSNLANIWVEEMVGILFQDCHEGEGGGFHSRRFKDHQNLQFIRDGEDTKCL
jgi:hypothetical protein